jgi:acyl dehydratase
MCWRGEFVPLDYAKVKNWPIPDSTQTYTKRDTILYALGVGAAAQDIAADLHLVYEKGLRALPSMAVVLAGGDLWIADPATGIDLTRLLHGEQHLRLHKPLPASGTLVGKHTVEEIFDKGADKGAVLILARRLYDQLSGELVAEVAMSMFLRGNGGFGGRAGGQPKPHAVPIDRAADLTLDLATRPEQAALYRWAGADLNPMHIDPAFAQRAGFDRPILHGLCSYGVAGRAVLKLLCDNDPARLRRLDVRFASPVYPGETLRVLVWREAPGRASFQVRIVERDQLVLNNGLVEFEP